MYYIRIDVLVEKKQTKQKMNSVASKSHNIFSTCIRNIFVISRLIYHLKAILAHGMRH